MVKAVASWSKPDGFPHIIARKRVDWSIFIGGSTIPVEFHPDFVEANGGRSLQRSESHELRLVVDGREFTATLINVDRTNIATDTLQIRYDSNAELRDLLKQRLESSYTYLTVDRESKVALGKKVYAKVPDSHAEYIDFYATEEPFKYLMEILPVNLTVPSAVLEHVASSDEYLLEHSASALPDEEFEAWLESADGSASVEVREGLRKIRKLQRTIITYLKAQYGGRCQICGYSTVTDYAVDTSEGHHIEYFTKSLNNKPSNVAILCPNHHALVHSLNATFDRPRKCFVGDGGQQLTLAINFHL